MCINKIRRETEFWPRVIKWGKPLVVLLLILSLLQVGLSLFLPSEPIGIHDGIRFFMRPRAVVRRLGDPAEKSCSDLNGDGVYTFQTLLDGVEAKEVYYFYHDWLLRDVYISADAGDAESAVRLFELWKARMVSAYENRSGFYCREVEFSSETSYSLRLGFEYGATGVSCRITVDGERITLSCTRVF